MGGWVGEEEWMGGWTEGGMDGRTDDWVIGLGRESGWADGGREELTDGQMSWLRREEGWVEGGRKGGTGGQLSGWVGVRGRGKRVGG